MFGCTEIHRSVYLSTQSSCWLSPLVSSPRLCWEIPCWCYWALLILLHGPRGDLNRTVVQLSSVFVLSWVFLMTFSSHLQERPSTSHTCVWSSTPAGRRALQSINAPGKMAHGCPTSTIAGRVRAPITKSIGVLFGLERMSSRHSAQMSSVTSPLSLGATWLSQRWRGDPVPTTLTTALCYRYASGSISDGLGWVLLLSCHGWQLCANCGLHLQPLFSLKDSWTGKLGWMIRRNAFEERVNSRHYQK